MGRPTFFRTAAVTTEQAVSTTRCRLIAVIPEPLTIAGTIHLRNAPAAELVGTPGTVAGTPSNTGGSLTNAASPYYARVVAVDVNGELSAGSTEQSDTIASGSTGSIAYTWVAGSGATPTSYRIYFGTATGVFDRYFDAGDVLAYTVTANSGGTAITPGDTAAATTGVTTRLVHKAAIGSLAAGKDFHGVECDRGLTIQLSNSADLTTVIYEPF